MDIEFSDMQVELEFRVIAELPGVPRKELLEFLQHGLSNAIARVIGYAELAKTNKVVPDNSPVEIDELNNIITNSRTLRMSLVSLVKATSEDDSQTKIPEMSQEFWTSCKSIADLMPMKGTYVNEEFAATTDNLGGILVYLLNRYFGSQSHQSYYYLNTDIENYTMCIQHREHGFEVRFYKIVHLKTSKDYFSNVIVPIIGNITDHAYNPDNDRFGRLEDPNFKKIYGISMKIANSEASASTASEDDNEDVTDKFVQIEMTDNGFGIPDCKKSGLFRRDSITNHGLGLSHAKKFLEDNGGKITVASEEGKGTTFTFYIPYQSKKGNLYIAE